MFARIRSHNLIRNVNSELIRLYVRKYIHQLTSPRQKNKTTLAILGCQRSGTSVMSRVFFRDLNCTVFREKSKLTGGNEGLRYLPFPRVRSAVDKERASLVVFKMLVESQRAMDFLQSVPNGKILWLFRHYKDVVSSNLFKFGPSNGLSDLEPIAAGATGNWRSENCSEETLGIVRRFYSESMNPNDAAALFWLVRNRLYFEQNLNQNDRSIIVEYEAFVNYPADTMARIYEFCGQSYPGQELTTEVQADSIAKGRAVELSPAVEELCADMLDKLKCACR